MTEARRREGVGFRPRPSNDAASVEQPRRSAKQKRWSAHRCLRGFSPLKLPRQGDSPAPARPAAPCSPDLTILRKSSVGCTIFEGLAGCKRGNFLSEATSSASTPGGCFPQNRFRHRPCVRVLFGRFCGTFYAATARPFLGAQVLRFVAPRPAASRPGTLARGFAPLDPRPR